MGESNGSAAIAGICAWFVISVAAGLTLYLTSDLASVGREVYGLLARADPSPASGGLHPYQVSLGICLLLVFLGYLVDIHLWRDAWLWKFTAKAYYAVVSFFFLAALLLYSTEAPSIPPLVGVGLGTWAVHLLRVRCFSHVSAEDFSFAASGAYTSVGFICGVVWLSWAFTPWENHFTWDWKDSARPSVDTQSFVRWCSPFVVGLIHVLIGLFLRLRSRLHMFDEYDKAELKLVFTSLVLLVLFTWLAASVAAGDAGLSKVVLRLSVAVGVGALVYLLWSVGPKHLGAVWEGSDAHSIITPLATSDWTKAIFVLLFLPLVPVFFALECLHMLARGLMRSACATYWERSKYRWITDEAALLMEKVGSWHASSVLSKSMWVGIVYFMVQVGCGRGVVVLLACVCEHSLHYSFPVILAILYGIGAGLFLLPPVPGCPIYIVSSILITKRFAADGRPWLLACFVATCWAMVIKLSAVAMQQKLIGETCSSSLYVKKLVSIHTPAMKVVRHILSQPGLKADKVAVLCCGPDWPTSVLTGILRLRCLEMLLGTLPIVCLIAPFTLSGSFMVHASSLPENSVAKRRFEGLSNAMVLLSLIQQMAGLMLIAQYTQAARDEFKDEIEAGEWMKDAQEAELLAKIAADEEESKLRHERTSWPMVPLWLRFLLVLGSLLMSLMMYVILLPFMKPFKDFSLQDKFSDIPDVYFLVNKAGWVAIAFLCLSTACLVAFEVWSAHAGPLSEEERPLRPSAEAAAPTYDSAEGTAVAQPC